jgi:hypothetical protein
MYSNRELSHHQVRKSFFLKSYRFPLLTQARRPRLRLCGPLRMRSCPKRLQAFAVFLLTAHCSLPFIQHSTFNIQLPTLNFHRNQNIQISNFKFQISNFKVES